MSACVRLIPCLDVIGRDVVKGRKFDGLRRLGDIKDFLDRYNEEEADEIIVLDIAATLEGRQTLHHSLSEVARSKRLPLTIGGGIRSFEDAQKLFDLGADRVSLNSCLYESLSLVSKISRAFGSQAVVASLDVSRVAGQKVWRCFSRAGRVDSGREMIEMARACVEAGAGEVLLTSIDRDGLAQGYDLEALTTLRSAVNVPIIASGGAGQVSDLVFAAQAGATGLLVATRLHERSWELASLSLALSQSGLKMRSRS